MSHFLNLYVLIDIGHSSLATNVSLLKASEVEEVFAGHDSKYRASTLSGSIESALARFVVFYCKYN